MKEEEKLNFKTKKIYLFPNRIKVMRVNIICFNKIK